MNINRAIQKWDNWEWKSEPDKLQWVDQETDLDCLIVRGPSGALCGYVGVPNSHPLFKVPYSDIDLSVHGGLTFSALCKEDNKEHGICHIPEDGRPQEMWWLGFDCAHGGDLTPAFIAMRKEIEDQLTPQMKKAFVQLASFRQLDTYKNITYVMRECQNLASQIKAQYS